MYRAVLTWLPISRLADLALSIHGKQMNRSHYVNTMEFLGPSLLPSQLFHSRKLTSCSVSRTDHVREKVVEKFLKNAPKL